MLTLRGPRTPCDFGERTDFGRRALEAFAVSLSQHRRNARTRSPSWCSTLPGSLSVNIGHAPIILGKLRLRSAIAHLPRCVWDTELARHLHHGTAEAHAHEVPLRCMVPLGGRQDDAWRAVRRQVRQDRV